MVEKRWLSKSQINTWRQCPYRWKLKYLDKLQSKPSIPLMRGSVIHKKIENFYKNTDTVYKHKTGTDIVMKKGVSTKGIENFKKFEEKRYESCLKNPQKYFNPLFQELKLSNNDLKLRGIVDAVYINPEDDGIIIIDWKTGKYRPDRLSDYRFELSMYKELFERQKGMKVKYWGIYFIDADKLFFEEVKPISIKAMFKAVDKAREGIEKGDYPCKPGILCKWCDYNDHCEEWK